MIRDIDLKQAIDYSEGQKDAAYMVLGEIVNLLNEFTDNIRIIGGWVPSLLYPDSDHIGSIDVDVLLNQLNIKKADSYLTIKRILERNGYSRHPEKYFTFVKTVVVQGVNYNVDVDFLSGKYGGDGGNVSKHVFRNIQFLKTGTSDDGGDILETVTGKIQGFEGGQFFNTG